MDQLTFILPFVGLKSNVLVCEPLVCSPMTPEQQSDDPALAVEVKLGCIHCTGSLKLFHSGRLHQCCLVNEAPRCQVWTSQLEGIHWPRLCLITFFCAWNIRHPILIWHPHGSTGWHLKSAIVGPAGKQVEHGTMGAISRGDCIL